MTKTTIQAATKTDIPAIQDIVAVTWPETYGRILSPAQLTYMIDLIYSDEALTSQMDSGHNFFILREQQTAIGFIDIEKCGDTDCKLHKIYLRPACHGKGYGRYLLDFAIKQGRKMGGQFLKLNVNRHNKAQGFYERMGFTIEQTVDIPIGEGYYMNDFIMVRSIKE